MLQTQVTNPEVATFQSFSKGVYALKATWLDLTWLGTTIAQRLRFDLRLLALYKYFIDIDIDICVSDSIANYL